MPSVATSGPPRDPEPEPGGAPPAPPAKGSRSRGMPRFRSPVLWILFYLSLLDVGANVFFAYPEDPRNISPSPIQQYLEYGRSVEGKLARMTRQTDEESAPILVAGWLTGYSTEAEPPQDEGTPRPIVTFYGMSHAQLLAKELASRDSSLEVRFRAAPQAVPTWSYTAYLYDRERVRSDAVVLTVMTNTIPLLSTTSGATMYFDGAYPYTWPRYCLEHGALRSVAPPFVSVDGYRKSFYERARWNAYVEWLARYDKYYDPLLFRNSLLDKSSLVRLLRRSYALATRRARQAEVYDEGRGFDPSSEEAAVLRAVVVEFARRARTDGAIPIVFIVNNRDTSDHAFVLLKPTLSGSRIPYLSSHEICPPNDPRNFLPDSHFQPSKNAELAQAMARLLHEALAERDPAPGSFPARRGLKE